MAPWQEAVYMVTLNLPVAPIVCGPIAYFISISIRKEK